jgi:hypothetical protein
MITPNIQGSVIIQQTDNTKCYGNAIIQADGNITVIIGQIITPNIQENIIIQPDENTKYLATGFYSNKNLSLYICEISSKNISLQQN